MDQKGYLVKAETFISEVFIWRKDNWSKYHKTIFLFVYFFEEGFRFFDYRIYSVIIISILYVPSVITVLNLFTRENE